MLVAVAGIAAAVASGCATPLAWKLPQAAGAQIQNHVPVPRAMMIGAYAPGLPTDWSGISTFKASTGVSPKIVVYYSGWLETFRASLAALAWRNGAYLLVQLQPSNISLSRITAGDYDDYLRAYARSVRAFGHPLILSFGHEMNGTWYTWADGHESPAAFVAAWRHIVTIFRSEGALNATWLWTVNSTNVASARLRPWWPGAAWVNWVGVDGYYYRPTDTFSTVFGQTITDVEAITHDPVLISEAAVGTTTDRGSQIKGMFAGARAAHVVGLVWFDEKQDDGIYHQDWRLEDDSAALAAFRSAAGTAGKAEDRDAEP